MAQVQQTAFFSMLLMLIAIAAAQTQCSTVISELTPCASYIQGQAGTKPPSECCDGVKQIYGMATQPEPDRAGICSCIKTELIQLKSVVASTVAGLPQSCGVSYQMPLMDPNFDCNTIK